MSDYDELISVLTDLLTNRFSPKPSFARGLLGDGQGNVIVPERPDKSFVRFNRGSNEFFEVFNRNVNPVHDWPVLIGSLPWQPGLTQIVDTDWSAFEQSGWGDILGSTSPHAPTHEWPDKTPGSDPLSVYLRSIVPMRAYTVGSGTTTVYVNSYEYEYQGSGQVWAGMPGIDMSPIINSMTTGTMRFMGVYLDPNTNTLGTITGATTVFTSAFDPPNVDFPPGNLPSAKIRLYGSQTGINEADINDVRQPFLPASTGTTATPEGPAGGDLTGTYPNPSVAGLFGSPLVDTTPAEGDLLMFTGSAWRPIAGASNLWPKEGWAEVNNVQYSTIAAAISAASAGDEIKIGAGTFTEQLTISKNLILTSASRDTTITNSSSPTILISGSADVTLKNLTIENTGTSSSQMIALHITTSGNVRIDNCEITADLNGTGSGRGVRQEISAADTRFIDCDINCSNANGGSTSNDAVNSAAGTIDIERGTLDGQVYDIQTFTTGTFVTTYGTRPANETFNEQSSNTITGWYTTTGGDIVIIDGVKLLLGTGKDGAIYSSSDNLYIENDTQDKDIIFKINDGGVGTEIMRADGSSSNIGMGTSDPQTQLHVLKGGIAGIPAPLARTTLLVQNTNTTGSFASMAIVGGNAGASGIDLGDTDNIQIGRVQYSHANNELYFFTANTLRVIIETAGHLVPNTNKSQNLGATSSRWNTLYQGTSTAAGTSRTFEIDKICPVCQTKMIRGTGSLCILGEDRDYEVAHCPNCGILATDELRHLPSDRLNERLPPPKIEFLGCQVFPMSGNSRKVRIDFRYQDEVLGDNDEVIVPEIINSTYLSDNEISSFILLSRAERKQFLKSLGRREWDALEEVRLMNDEVATLQTSLDNKVADLIGIIDDEIT